MDHSDVSTVAAPERRGLPGLARSALRILVGVEAGLAALIFAGIFFDPYSPAGCPDSASMGRDCVRFGLSGRAYASYLQVRANQADTPRRTLELVDQAIAIRPNFVFAYNTRGLAYAAMGKPDEALKAFDRSLELAPHYIGARANRALLYQEIGRPRDAARDFRAVYASPPNSHKRAEVVAYARAVDRTMQ